MKRTHLVLILIAILLALPCLSLSAGAESETLSLTPSYPALTDGREGTSASVKEVTLTASEPITSLYLLYYDTPTDFVIRSGEVEKTVEGAYLRRFVELESLLETPAETLTLTFADSVRLLEIYAFSGEVPDWVQIWDEPCEKADLCLMTTHADDEQLFFAGILPYYAGEKGYEVQVVYFTDHKNEPLRRHELLRGLWTVGVRHYPVISPFPDLYSEAESVAENQFATRGFDRETVIGFQVEMLRRFRPLVVIGHDPEGEYGHGQH
ncbi:MAG: PIG-L family deacetylase, partial [Clostridia bacterium]|nr:PIG-L family deacetylase [Clostridia bacterium]